LPVSATPNEPKNGIIAKLENTKTRTVYKCVFILNNIHNNASKYTIFLIFEGASKYAIVQVTVKGGTTKPA